MKIFCPNGVVIDAAAVPKLTDGHYDTGRRTVPASGVYRHSLVLNSWSSFDLEGTYRVEIDLTAAIETESGAPVPSTTRGVLLVRVGARDDRALHRICQELLERIALPTADPTSRYLAAMELATVTDDVAFPYIMQVIGLTDRVDGVMIPALAKMKTFQARALLDEMARSDNDTRASMALAALLKR